MDWICLAPDRVQWQNVVEMAVTLRLAKSAGNVCNSSATLSFSRKILVYGVGFLAFKDSLQRTRSS